MDKNNYDIEVYKIFRDRCTAEDSQIDTRVNWLIWLQTSFLATWFAIYFQLENDVLSLKIKEILPNALLVISIFSILISIIAMLAIGAAYREINVHRKRYMREYMDMYDSHQIPRLTGNKMSRSFGVLLPFSVSTFYSIFWGFISYWSWTLPI